jgi:hypothetical protein
MPSSLEIALTYHEYVHEEVDSRAYMYWTTLVCTGVIFLLASLTKDSSRVAEGLILKRLWVLTEKAYTFAQLLPSELK